MQSTIEIRQLKAFLALVAQGSVTAAAQTLGFAQSTISEALSSLERALGTPLFLRRRGSHELVLTEAGQALLPHAHAVLAQIADAHVAVAAVTTGARARVAIASNESLSTYILAPQLHRLRRQWPNTTFEVTVMLCAGVRSGVESGEYDLGMILEPGGNALPIRDGARTIISSDVPLVMFAQPAHPLARSPRTPVPRDALAEYPLYISDAAGDFHLLVRHYLEHDGLPGPRIHPTGSVESVKRSVLGDEHAIGLLPAYALADELRDRRMVSLRVQPGPPRMSLEVLTSRTRSEHPATRQLILAMAAAYLPGKRAAIG